MPNLVDQCLNLSEGDVQDQWQRIADREWQRRQETYLPIELILCVGLFRIMNPHGFGGSNLDRVPAEVKALAATLRRPIGSLTNKMLNLEGFRANGARHETELFLRLGLASDRFAALYMLIIGAARAHGLDEVAVPDFLGWTSADAETALVGQEELGVAEVELALEANVEDLRAMKEVFGFDEMETSRVVEQRARLGQHRFARTVLGNYQRRCAFCGLDVRELHGHRLLVASHIKPWAASTHRERLDPRNGVAACAIHDSAFDTGLITIDQGLNVVHSAKLATLILTNDGMNRFFGSQTMLSRILSPKNSWSPAPRYLEYHRQTVFHG